MTKKIPLSRIVYEIVYWVILVGVGISSGKYISTFAVEVLNSSNGTMHKAFHDTNAANEN